MSDDKKSELKIKAIENGTVIDHITANKSLHILKILELPNDETKNVTRDKIYNQMYQFKMYYK